MSRSSVMSFCPLLSIEIFHIKLRTASIPKHLWNERKRRRRSRKRRKDSTCSEMFHSFHLNHYCQPQDGMLLWSFKFCGKLLQPWAPSSRLLEMLCYCFTTSQFQHTLPAAHPKPCPSHVSMLCHTWHVHWLCQEVKWQCLLSKWHGLKLRASKGEGVHGLILPSVTTFSVTNISKPYLWLAGHVSVLSKPGYRLCGFLMIYLHKICGMLKMELSTLLYGTLVHVRKWKYFQKWYCYVDW